MTENLAISASLGFDSNSSLKNSLCQAVIFVNCIKL